MKFGLAPIAGASPNHFCLKSAGSFPPPRSCVSVAEYDIKHTLCLDRTVGRIDGDLDLVGLSVHIFFDIGEADDIGVHHRAADRQTVQGHPSKGRIGIDDRAAGIFLYLTKFVCFFILVNRG